VPVKVPRRLSSSRPRWGACVRLGKPGHSGTGKGI
jgi:hypothetical protein